MSKTYTRRNKPFRHKDPSKQEERLRHLQNKAKKALDAGKENLYYTLIEQASIPSYMGM